MNFYFLSACKDNPYRQNKILLAMKLTIILMIATLLQVNAAGYAQKVSLVKKNTPLEQVFEEIRTQTGYNFLYDVEMLKDVKPIDLQFNNVPLKEALRKCFEDLPLTYTIKKNTIVIQRRIKQPVLHERSASLKKEVRGTVRDSTGTLPGVSVTVKNRPGVGTTTDVNGKYVLDVPDESSTLVFTMVGYAPQEIPVSGKDIINVTLSSASSALEEVVVVAFGTQKKTDVIGSVTSINPSDLKVPSSNLTTALAGRLSGIISYQRSGEPGQDNAEFFIRGVTTFGYKTDPLILIDGVELSTRDLAQLQPDDIASFTIMKDATATALYGARGANGVILVTTKEGKPGKAKVSVRLENSMSSPTRNVDIADPVSYMTLSNEATLTRYPDSAQPYSQLKIDNTAAGFNSYVFPAIDWRKELFKDYASNQRVNFSASGGGAKVARYYLAGTVNKDNGVLKVDNKNNFNTNIDLKTYLLRSNINIDITKSTEVAVRLYGTFDEYTGPMQSGSGIYGRVMRSSPVNFPAYYPVDEEHKYITHTLFGNDGEGNYLNPYADMVKGYKNYSRSMMSAQFEIKQDLSGITEGLSLRGMGNTNRLSYFDVSRAYNPFYYRSGNYNFTDNSYKVSVLNPDTGTDYLGYGEGEKTLNSNLYVETAANYNRTFNSRHTVSALMLFMLNNRLVANAGSLFESLPYRNTGLSGRATYSYNNRYFGEFNFGYNGSERFYKTDRFGFFPSAGVAWYVSNEKFWDPLKSVISKLKFRGTYGLVGNDAIGGPEDRFFYLSDVNMNNAGRGAAFGRDNGYSRNGISISRYGNQDITWETAKKVNLGVELGLLNKVEVLIDMYREKRTNILMSRANSTPTYLGLEQAVKANVGAASGEGIDVSIDYSDHFGKNFWITSRGNFTYAKSAYDIFEEPDYKEQYQSRLGYSVRQQWGYIAERLFVDDNEVSNSPKQNFGDYGAGDIKYRDLNGDGQITSFDKAPIGYPTVPEIIYGFGFSTGYKNLDLSCFLQGSARSSFWIDANATSPFAQYQFEGRLAQNQLLKAYSDDHWSENNRNIYALWPRLSPGVSQNNTQTSTWFMRNGAFLRLKTVELGYSLPKSLTKKAGVELVRIYATGLNLFSASKFKLWDVEMGGNGLGYPIQKVINVGAQVSF